MLQTIRQQSPVGQPRQIVVERLMLQLRRERSLLGGLLLQLLQHGVEARSQPRDLIAARGSDPRRKILALRYLLHGEASARTGPEMRRCSSEPATPPTSSATSSSQPANLQQMPPALLDLPHIRLQKQCAGLVSLARDRPLSREENPGCRPLPLAIAPGSRAPPSCRPY